MADKDQEKPVKLPSKLRGIKLDDDGLPVVEPPRKEDAKDPPKPLNRLGRSWKTSEAWMNRPGAA